MKKALEEVKALTFDVFGTVVDWRGTVIREGRKLGAAKRLKVDWAAFADGWRAGYAPAMDRVRRGELAWMPIDALHRMVLDDLLAQFGIADAFDDAERTHFNLVWHRLKPWPDAVAGLRRLKKRFVIATLSNGNVALLLDMAKQSKLPWDTIFSAELFHHYKPDPQAYLGACELLGLRPWQVMMVAAHKSDLDSAKRCGLKAAFVQRPLEFGPKGKKDVAPEARFEVNAKDFGDLAKTLGA